MSINTIRHVLYAVAKYLGDVNAVEKHKVIRCVGYRIVGKITGRLLGRLFR